MNPLALPTSVWLWQTDRKCPLLILALGHLKRNNDPQPVSKHNLSRSRPRFSWLQNQHGSWLIFANGLPYMRYRLSKAPTKEAKLRLVEFAPLSNVWRYVKTHQAFPKNANHEWKMIPVNGRCVWEEQAKFVTIELKCLKFSSEYSGSSWSKNLHRYSIGFIEDKYIKTMRYSWCHEMRFLELGKTHGDNGDNILSEKTWR